jgi:hypothetical protein
MEFDELKKLQPGDLVRFLTEQSSFDGHRTQCYADKDDVGRVIRVENGQALIQANAVDRIWCNPFEIGRLNLLERIAWEVELAERNDRNRRALWGST